MFARHSMPPPFFFFLFPYFSCQQRQKKRKSRARNRADGHTEFLLPIRIWVNYRIRIYSLAPQPSPAGWEAEDWTVQQQDGQMDRGHPVMPCPPLPSPAGEGRVLPGNGITSKSQNHGMVWLGSHLKNHIVPTPCQGQGHPPSNQIAHHVSLYF